MIISKITSGLGNQLFQYVIGRQISLKRNEPLQLDISFYKSQCLRTYKLDRYNINASIASEKEISKFTGIYTDKTLSAFVKRRIQNNAPKHKKLIYCEDQWWTYEPLLLKAGPKVYIEGYWQHYRYFENIQPLILSELRLKNNQVNTIQDLGSEAESNPSSVSVHVRRGDYITNAGNHPMQILPIEYYKKAFLYMNNRIKDAKYYFFSDDLDWAKDNMVTHRDNSFVEINDDCKELEVMSKCSHNVIANSSFSWWAAYLNKNPKKVIVSPMNWVADININRRIEIQFPSWIKL